MNSSDDIKIPQFEDIRNWLIGHIADHLNIAPDAVDVNEPFESFGMTSKEMVMISGDLEEWLEIRLEPTLVWQYPTIDAISRFLAGENIELGKGNEASLPERNEEPIAIIGIGCRFPGGKGPDAFWDVLVNGRDTISQFPRKRWEENVIYAPSDSTAEKIKRSWGGFIEDEDQFDNEFFKISPREAVSIDPQQRLLLEVTWEALEHAGIVPQQLAGSSTGAFIGISTNDYSMLQFSDLSLVDAYAGTGNAHSVAANRLSYFFDFQGPSLAMDTACSSSLVSVHVAANSLKAGECDLALAGGVNLLLSPALTLTFSEAQMLAADGRCKTFDARADGYVRSEGCGVVVLKRLADAQRDGDQILALLRGSAINHDGKSNGLTAPNGLSQQAVIRRALINANLNPEHISYLEAHGTGTRLGDPIEFNALKAVFPIRKNVEEKLALGSVKTNIGHLESAAGIASFIKVVLALQYEVIPPHLHLKELNPQISLIGTPFTIPSIGLDWPVENQRVRYAGISSFGFGGTNAHVILEGREGIEREPEIEKTKGSENQRSLNVLSLSARNESGLRELSKKYLNFLESQKSSDIPIGDICYTANTTRQKFDSNVAFIAKDKEGLKNDLLSFVNGTRTSGYIQNTIRGQEKIKKAFLFTGQGSQYVGMARELYSTEPIFRDILDECDEIAKEELEPSLLSEIFAADDKESLINETAYTQPALFSVEIGLAVLLREWGVQPDLVLGHSIGEFAAACFAGAFSVEDGLRLVSQRGRLMQGLSKEGSMAVVFAEISQVERAIDDFSTEVSIATINGPTNIVISGSTKALQKIVKGFRDRGIESRSLEVSHAFHSPLMEPVLEPFQKVTEEVNFKPLIYPLASNLTGQIIQPGEVLSGDYWVQHVRKPVLFASGMSAVIEKGVDISVEIGPSPVLLGMAKRLYPQSAIQWLPTLRKGKSDWQVLVTTLAALDTLGVRVDWNAIDQHYHRKRVSIPTYPFNRRRFWFDNRKRERTDPGESDRRDQDQAVQWLHELVWEASGWTQQPNAGNEKMINHIIFGDRSGLGASLAGKIEMEGGEAILVYPGRKYEKIDNHYIVNPKRKEDLSDLIDVVAKSKEYKVIHLWSLDADFMTGKSMSSLQEDIELSCISGLNILQVFEQFQKSEDVRISVWFITRGAQQVGENSENLVVSQAPLWGLGRTAALELPAIWGGLIDLDPDGGGGGVSEIWNTITSSDKENQVAFREGRRYLARLEPSQGSLPVENRYVCDSESTYLISGGTGSLGLSVVKRLMERGARHFILISRTDFTSGLTTGDPAKEELLSKKREEIKALQDQGVEISLVALDVADEDQVSALFKEGSFNLASIKGIIHMAGVVEPQPIRELSPEAFLRVLSPKVDGSWLLHKYSEDLELDFFLLFSSASSVLNSPFLGSYAAANTFLDALAHYRHSVNQTALSVNWGFWAGGGMAKQYQESMGRTLIPRGMVPIQTESGLDIMEGLLSSDRQQVAVLPTDWEIWAQNQPRIRTLPLFSNILGSRFVDSDSLQTEKFEILADTVVPQEVEASDLFTLPPEQWVDFLIKYLIRSVAAALYMDPAEVDPGMNLMELGIDSLMVMELTGNLERDFQITVYPREVFERPSIQSFAEYLENEIRRLHPMETAVDQIPPSPTLMLKPQLGNNFLGIPVGIDGYHEPAQKNPKAVFILSSPRAGSTLLRVMLTGHPNLFCPPELHLLPFENMKARAMLLGESYLGEGLIRALMEINQAGVEPTKQMVDEWIEGETAIEDVYRFLQMKIEPNLLVDKSPSYAINLEVLERAEILFEQPKFIFLARHPYSVMESFVRNRIDKVLGIDGVDPYDVAENIWVEMNANILDFFADLDPSRYHLLKYEHLVVNTETEMSKLCQFLDIKFHEAILDPYGESRMTDGLHVGSRPIGDPNFLKHSKIDSSLGEAWEQIQLPRRLGGYAKRVAKELEYELPSETRKPLARGKPGDSMAQKPAISEIKRLSRDRHRVKAEGQSSIDDIDETLKNQLFRKE